MAGWIIERRLRDGRVVYDIGYRLAGRLVKRKGGDTASEAEAALTIALAEIETGIIRAHTTYTLAGYAARWLELRQPFVSGGTWHDYRYAVEIRIAPTLGSVKLRDLTHAAIREAVVQWQKMRPRGRRRASGYSAKTINNTLSVLSDILGTAVAEGLIRDNPTQRQGGAARERLHVHADFRELEYLDPDEIPRYLAACDDEYHDLGAVLALAGARISEALALEPRDVDARGGLLVIARSLSEDAPGHLKDQTPRRVEIGPRLAKLLGQRAAACRRRGEPLLFPDPVGGGYIDRRSVARRWHEPALRAAGINRHLRVHDLRHTAAATWLIAGKQSMEYVRRQLGHKDIRQTQIYAHVERRGRSTAADETERGIWGDEPRQMRP
jgi:integrase